MRIRSILPLVGLVALAGAVTGCKDEKKAEPANMSKPAPAADPAKPDAAKTEPAKPAEKQ